MRTRTRFRLAKLHDFCSVAEILLGFAAFIAFLFDHGAAVPLAIAALLTLLLGGVCNHLTMSSRFHRYNRIRPYGRNVRRY